MNDRCLFSSADEVAEEVIALCEMGLLEAAEREDGQIGFHCTDMEVPE